MMLNLKFKNMKNQRTACTLLLGGFLMMGNCLAQTTPPPRPEEDSRGPHQQIMVENQDNHKMPQRPMDGNRGQGRKMRFSPGEILEQLRLEKPEEHKRLMELRNQDHKKFFEELRKYMQAKSNALDLIIQKEKENRELARKILATQDKEEQEKLKAELNQRLETQFTEMIEETEKRLNALMQRLNEMKKNRAEIQKKRFEELLSGKRLPPLPGEERKPPRKSDN